MMKRLASVKQLVGAHPFEEVVVRLLRDALGTWVEVEAPSSDSASDAVVRFPDGKTVALQFKSPGVRQAAAASDTADHVVYVLERATRRAQDELRRNGLSFVDIVGTVHLALPNLLVDRTNLRPPAKRGIASRRFDAFSDRGSLVARTLLEDKDRDERIWGVRELAAVAGVSPATTTRVVRELERLPAVQVKRQGRTAAVRLADAAALFAAWTRTYDWTRNRSVAFHAPMGDASRFITRMAKEWTGPRWALTLQAGAARVAPLATWDRVHMYVDAKDESALVRTGEDHGWEPADDGRLVLLRPYYRTSVWHGLRTIGGAPVVSDLQLALDLWHYPLRGREQAEHLLSAGGLAG
jgi:hypothetical protein